MKIKPLINLVCALHSEAKPLIKELRLSRIVDQPLSFPVFANKDKTINLIITGIGKIRMAAATAFIYQWTGAKSYSCFLNIGVCGSLEFAMGELLLVNKISEASTHRSWYPHVAAIKFKQQAELRTYDLPQTSYPLRGLIDMEGAAFFQSANCFVSLEQSQLLKVVSDNNVKTLQELNESKVVELTAMNLESIKFVVQELLQLSSTEATLQKDVGDMSQFLATWRFSHAQKLILQEYLRRWQIQMPTDNPLEICKSEKNASQVIQKIMNELDLHANSIH